jgi:hypothetical protein
MKRQRRRRGVPKAEVGSVTQVPENSLHRLCNILSFDLNSKCWISKTWVEVECS